MAKQMEAIDVLNMLKAQGLSDSQIVQTFFSLYINGQVSLEILCDMVSKLNYTVTDEFKELSLADLKKKGLRLIKKNK